MRRDCVEAMVLLANSDIDLKTFHHTMKTLKVMADSEENKVSVSEMNRHNLSASDLDEYLKPFYEAGLVVREQEEQDELNLLGIYRKLTMLELAREV